VLTVAGVLAEYEALEKSRGAPLTKSKPTGILTVGWAKPTQGFSNSAIKRRIRLGPVQTHLVIFQYLLLSTAAPGVGASKMEGRAEAGSTGGAPGIWSWCASVACTLEDVNTQVYGGQKKQSDLLVVRAAALREIRERMMVQLAQFRSLAKRSHDPKAYSHRIDVATKTRDAAGLVISQLSARRSFDREVVIAMDSLEIRHVRPLVI
jgi:hypothetical protein